MKVGTDGVLLPAWLSSVCCSEKDEKLRILDVGAGTGIISLMLAQAFPKAQIIALEINKDAICDATINIGRSPFGDRVELLDKNFLDYEPAEPFDMIVSNPPYFASTACASPDDSRALARQEDKGGLTLEKLMQRAKLMLSDREEASLFLITPLDREDDLRRYACETLLLPKSLCRVYSSPKKGIRLLSQWTRQRLTNSYFTTELSKLNLYNEVGQKSSRYTELLRPFLP